MHMPSDTYGASLSLRNLGELEDRVINATQGDNLNNPPNLHYLLYMLVN